MKVNYLNKVIKESACKITQTICLPDSQSIRVEIIGVGFTGLTLIEKLKYKDVQVVLLDKNNFYQFQRLFYQVATSTWEPSSIVFPFRKQINGYKNVLCLMAEVYFTSLPKKMLKHF